MNLKPLLYLAFANDRSGDECFLEKLKNERIAIPSTLKDAIKQGICETYVEPDATIDDFARDFINPEMQSRIVVFHYAGHASEEGWHVENSTNAPNEMAYAQGTAKMLGALPCLQLVFLNGCNTEAQIALLRAEGIKNIIATAAAIDDDAAVTFATNFYHALGIGKTLQAAFEFAQNVAYTKYGNDTRGTWKIPPKNDQQPPPFPWKCDFQTPNWSLPTATVGEKPNLEVFMTYSEEDRKEADTLYKFLKILKRQGLINTFSMYNMADRVAGGDIEKDIKRKLLNARIILLLITPDFLTDDLCAEIEEIAMQRHHDKTAAVIPIWLKTSPTDGFSFTRLQGLPFNAKPVDKWSNKDEAFTEVTKGIRQLVQSLTK